jgi:hypothetical protein
MMEVIKGDFRAPQEDLQGLLEDLTTIIELMPQTTSIVSIIGVLEVIKLNLMMGLTTDEDDY